MEFEVDARLRRWFRSIVDDTISPVHYLMILIHSDLPDSDSGAMTQSWFIAQLRPREK
jgi:hypothetical protein